MIITVFFTHEVIHPVHVHLLSMLLVYLLFGLLLEREVGPFHTTGVYVLAGIAGSLAILTVADIGAYEETIAGSSAAAHGVIAAIAVLTPNTIVGESIGDAISLKNVAILALVFNVVGSL